MLRFVAPLAAVLVFVPAAAGTIPPPRDPVPALSIGDATTHGTNFDTDVSLEVTLTPPTDDAVTVHWATADGTADSTDYIAGSGTLRFAPRQTSARIVVESVAIALDEADETFFVDLSAASFATIDRGRGAVTIVDDDPAPFRLLDAWVDARWAVHKGYTRVARFAIHRPARTTAKIRCRGRGCPLHVGARLRPGTVVDVWIEAPYQPLIGRVYRYRIRAGKAPRLTALCLPPGALVPKSCAS